MKTPRDTTAVSSLEFVKIFIIAAACFGGAILASTGGHTVHFDAAMQGQKSEQTGSATVAYRSRHLRFNEYLFNGSQRVTAVV